MIAHGGHDSFMPAAAHALEVPLPVAARVTSGDDGGGVLFPLGENGKRSTMASNRAVWADAARAVDEELTARISGADPWRSEYLPHVRTVTELGARSADTATRVAESGLAAARAQMVFRREGTDHPLA